MDLVVHIGMPKTGTTSIQRTLKALSASGDHGEVCYPLPEGRGHAHTHLLALDTRRTPPPFLEIIYGKDTATLRRAGLQMLSEIEAMVLESGASVCVLSTEAWFFRPELLSEPEFVRFIKRRFSNLRIIAYTRRPSDYYASACLQNLRQSSVIVQPKAPRFRLIAETCARAGNVEFVAFEHAMQHPHGVVGDFLKRIGVESVAALPELGDEDTNRSLSAEAAQVLLDYREMAGASEGAGPFQVAESFVRELRDLDATSKAPKARLRETLIHFLDQPTPDLEYLRLTFGIDYPSEPQGRTEHVRSLPLELGNLFELDAGLLQQYRTWFAARRCP